MPKTENTGKEFHRVPRSYSPDVHAAWEVYGPFGRSYGVFEKTNLGTDAVDVPADAMKGRRWIRLVWVKYSRQ